MPIYAATGGMNPWFATNRIPKGISTHPRDAGQHQKADESSRCPENDSQQITKNTTTSLRYTLQFSLGQKCARLFRPLLTRFRVKPFSRPPVN